MIIDSLYRLLAEYVTDLQQNSNTFDTDNIIIQIISPDFL